MAMSAALRMQVGSAAPGAAAAARTPAERWLDALPMPAAFYLPGEAAPRLLATNRGLAVLLAGAATPTRGDGEAARTLLNDRVATFLRGNADAEDGQWCDRDAVDARHFAMRLARVDGQEGPGCLLTLIERTNEVNTARSLRAEMSGDSLTGLPNRAAFIEAVGDALVERAVPGHSGGVAVLVVDLNRFSRINECLGALAGDELIITVARRLLSTLRIGDLLARIGGDEFAVLLRTKGDAEEAASAAARLRTVLGSPFRLAELEIGVSCAVGMALARDDDGEAEDLVRNAQFALKRAKATGHAELYLPGEVTAARQRLSLETALRRAIDNGELRLAFQPLVDLATGRATGVEALARWPGCERPVSPTEFIAVAEESGLIVPLGRWALDEALGTLAAWDRRAGRALPIRVSVNVSAIQLQRDDVAAAVSQALASHGVGGDRLTLELTESAIVRDPDRASEVLGALQALDVRIAMDDFGTGYSSLAYLQRLPIDMLKIDRSFVTGMLADRDKVAIVRAVLGLASALGMKTTAEGIETVALAQTLAALGCSHGQGHYFAAALAPDDAFDYLCARIA